MTNGHSEVQPSPIMGGAILLAPPKSPVDSLRRMQDNILQLQR